MKKINIIDAAKTLILVLVLSIGAQYLFAWTGPCGSPASCNAPAPINVAGALQSKDGPLTINASTTSQFPIGFETYGTSIFHGTMRIATGTPAAGKVLTALDSSGNASWQTPAATSTATSSGSTFVATDGDLIVVNGITTANSWVSVDLGPAGLNLVPAGAKTVMLKAFLSATVNQNNGVQATLNYAMYAKGYTDTNTKTVTNANMSINNGGSGYAITGFGSGVSGTTVVSLDGSTKIWYQVARTITNGGVNTRSSLYVVGYTI
ncbi:MAG: hypothetical protein JWO73_450 [Candidatus Taylorbacteria bacterium]|nr:hypothetical protein [Candidatus Taylorbacteria bacterium]